MADFDSRFALAEQLNKIYPGDPGVLLALFMNHVFLEPGESLFLPAGNIHAYLSGLGVEVMAASDNVLRGGLTTKHIDVNELEAVLNFTPMPVPKVRSVELSSGLIHYPCDTDDFLLYRLEPNGQRVMAEISLPGESIILCTAGEVAISNSLEESLILRRGEAAYLSGEARYFNLSGSGTAFLASSTR
jgi:mannose-6-phosphate isomerase